MRMMTRAYRQYYLEDAMGVPGAAVMLFEVPLVRFWPIFLASRQARQFAAEDPLAVSGQSGWALAQYQWYRGFPFGEIEEFAPMTDIVRLYSPYHEMSIQAFHEELDRRYRIRHPETHCTIIIRNTYANK